MTIMFNTVNRSDVPLVNASDLAMPMQHLVATGRGLAMLRGLTDAELREVDHAMWGALKIEPAQRVAVLLRFRCLIKAFGARRLADLLMHRGYNLIAPAVQVAAEMRLNGDYGFNPVKFERALRERLAAIDGADSSPATSLAA
jgi:hypothetical protein